MHHLFVVFATIFLAELGDKTQLATLLFAADGRHSPVAVFLAAAAALVASTALAVMLGTFAERHLTALPLRLVAGIAFMTIGAWMVLEHLRS